jgi:predicted nucleotidyltransferase component of viral defense system
VIPKDNLQAWSATAPWPDPRQVEQDLIICRALCDLFTAETLKGKLAFRGGTAINKLLFAKPLRYSEDIDLVQPEAAPIGETVDAIRDALKWLGKCNVDRSEHSTHLYFKFAPEADAAAKLKLKIEINGREHGALYGFKDYPFVVGNPWFSAKATIKSFSAEELFATKLRALLQRDKGRDLFDFRAGLAQLKLDSQKVVAGFEHYLAAGEQQITRANAEMAMLRKLKRSLTEDISPLLPAGVKYEDADALAAFEAVWFGLIARIKGEPWKQSQAAIEELRKTLGQAFLQEKPAG